MVDLDAIKSLSAFELANIFALLIKVSQTLKCSNETSKHFFLEYKLKLLGNFDSSSAFDKTEFNKSCQL